MHINDKDAKAVFLNKAGQPRELRKTRHGWQIKKGVNTVPRMLSRGVAHLLGPKIRKVRRKVGMGPTELALRMGYTSYNIPKMRIYEIEKGRLGDGNHSIRLGTLYAIAAALGVEVAVLLPSVKEVMSESGVVMKPTEGERLSSIEEPEEDEAEHRISLVKE